MLINRIFLSTVITVLLLAAAQKTAAEDKLLKGTKVPIPETIGSNQVQHRCLLPDRADRIQFPLDRKDPWSLPTKALAADFLDTLHILVLRFNFQFETVDNPNTTGRGRMDISRPLDTLTDDEYIARIGHIIDPPPHNADYYDAHLRALRNYYEIVSEGKITLSWDVYPQLRDSAYELPNPMSSYGRCDFDSVVVGLENYFIDCIQLVDTIEPDINFGDYDSYFLFHAGSDRQNDIGFPETCGDLFTGYISFGDTLFVDNDSNFVRSALMTPETAVQDNRVTALNAVLAHEFGHQLGLVDLYSTRNFMSQLGDFTLMDNNGFGTGIDFGFPFGRAFGAIPLFPEAWSRAYLGFVDVYDFRQGEDIQVAAAEVVSSGIKVARVPITEKEYYLIENRVLDIDGLESFMRVDSATRVLLGPVTADRVLNREYDFLMPGSGGLLIFHVDERVAGLDNNYDGDNNFDDNQLQWYADIFGNPVDRFITLVEGDGFVNFGGYYRAGYGREEDMYREDRNHSFTPNTNPQAIDNSGNNTHIYITGITRVYDSSGFVPVPLDTLMSFNVETDGLVPGFPVRAGQPVFPIAPIADDLDNDGRPEIIIVSDEKLLVTTPGGENFLREFTNCAVCPQYFDSAIASVHTGNVFPVPMYSLQSNTIFAGPVTGNFAGDTTTNKLVVVGQSFSAANGRVNIYRLADINVDGQADPAGGSGAGFFSTIGTPIAMRFGDLLYVLTDSGYVYRKDALPTTPQIIPSLNQLEYLGLIRAGDGVGVLAGDATNTNLYYLDGTVRDSISLDGHFPLGPVLADIDLDGVPNIVVAGQDGAIVVVAFDLAASTDRFSVIQSKETGGKFTVNPVIGDVDLDGLPDIVIGGTNAVYAFNHELILKTSFPIEVNDRFPNDDIISPPIVADISRGGVPEIVFPTEVGNIYSYGPNTTYGFPLSAGEISAGSPVLVNDTSSAGLGYLGADGWFYLWQADNDSLTNFWPMTGADPTGSYNFDVSKLPAQKIYSNDLPKERFFNYPNPVVDGSTTIRYFLGEAASSVQLKIFDLTGKKVVELSGPTSGAVDNELIWDCSNVTPGVYRCVIDVDFNGRSESAFTDIAVIR